MSATATTTDLTQLTPPQVDELLAEALIPVAQAQHALNGTRNSLRRYARAGRTPQYLLDAEAKDEDKLAEAREALAPFDAEFARRGGWTRYMQVTSSPNGHIHHDGHACSSLHPGRTTVTPVFRFSGEDNVGVVLKAGHTACTKCFPDAPVAVKASKPGTCSGSGRVANMELIERMSNRVYKSGRCPDCGKGVSLTPTFKFRQHKPEGA